MRSSPTTQLADIVMVAPMLMLATSDCAHADGNGITWRPGGSYDAVDLHADTTGLVVERGQDASR